MTAEDRLRQQLAELGLEMPAAAVPKGVYRPALRIGDLLYTAGHLPVQADGSLVTGRLGDGIDVAAGSGTQVQVVPVASPGIAIPMRAGSCVSTSSRKRASNAARLAGAGQRPIVSTTPGRPASATPARRLVPPRSSASSRLIPLPPS